MTKAEIRAELRRSAMEDRSPWSSMGQAAFEMALHFKRDDAGSLFGMDKNNLRTFLLIVAEAL